MLHLDEVFWNFRGNEEQLLSWYESTDYEHIYTSSPTGLGTTYMFVKNLYLKNQIQVVYTHTADGDGIGLDVDGDWKKVDSKDIVKEVETFFKCNVSKTNVGAYELYSVYFKDDKGLIYFFEFMISEKLVTSSMAIYYN